jgi:signal transduction histidine kinase
VLLGAAAEGRHDLRVLRATNEDLLRLRDTEFARGALEERARLAREVHDGLAQDLWFAKLKQGRLAQMAGLGREAQTLVGEVAHAIDAALTEARQAVLALKPHRLEGGSFGEVLTRYVHDFGDRFALRTEMTGAEALNGLSPRAQAELLRIVQEAMNNSRRHADATMIRVRAESEEDRLRIAITDNGRGFDVAEAAGDGYGLQSMRERASLIGGRVTVASSLQDGATVTVELPVRTDA